MMRTLWSSILNSNIDFTLLLLLTATRPSIAAFKNDFSDYPSGTQTCLTNASNNSGCTGDTSAQMNLCLCSNGGKFVTNSAKCIARQDSADMASTWVRTKPGKTSGLAQNADTVTLQEIMELHCSDSNTPLSVPKAQWMGYQSSVSTSSTATATTTSTSTSTSGRQTATVTSTPSPNPDGNNSGNSGLSSGAKIGIIAGSAAVGVALLAAALFLCIRYRKRRETYHEVHPMLLANPQHGPFGDGSADASAHRSHHHISMGPSELESAAPSVAGSPSDRSTWHSSSDGSQVPWSPGAFESVKMAHFQSLHQPPPREDVYEMPGETAASMSPSTIPVEMPTISVTSPTVSPTSRYSGLDWSSEPAEPRRYEPFRPR